ncbi:MAG: cobalt transporter CbiM [Oscillospiraceae bacterium]|nr:cobalt transporter CbiM [Oscillospiraceae bacterium]
MHIPENYLSPATCAVMTAAVAPVWAVSVKKIQKQIPMEKLPMLGAGAALSFLLMMFNVPLPGGTTGHAVGGTLLAILMGPNAACVSVSVALLLQALLFGDGGVLSFGANCFNMAFVLPFAGYAVFCGLKKLLRGTAGELTAAAIGSWVGLNAAAFCTAIEFGLQPLISHDAAGLALYCPYPLAVAIPAMMIPHMLAAGVVEAALTAALYAFLRKTSLAAPSTARATGGVGVLALLGVLIAATPLGLLAEGTAWGEWDAETVGQMLGYTPAGMEHGFSFSALMPDYTVAGIPEIAGYLVSAVCGAALLVIVFKLLTLRKSNRSGSL